MNLVEHHRAVRQLRLSGMAAALGTRLRQAQAKKMAHPGLLAALVGDERRKIINHRLARCTHKRPSRRDDETGVQE